jgi:hypothetical protein
MIIRAPARYWIYDVSYDEAILYCFQLEIDGKRGWRLPTMHEYVRRLDIWLPRLNAIWFLDFNSSVRYDCIPVIEIDDDY